MRRENDPLGADLAEVGKDLPVTLLHLRYRKAAVVDEFGDDQIGFSV